MTQKGVKLPTLTLPDRISPDDQDRLRQHFAELVRKTVKKYYTVEPFQVCKPHLYRRAAVVRAREEVVLELRRTVWYLDTVGWAVPLWAAGTGACYEGSARIASVRVIAINLASELITPRWRRISMPMIAALFPCHHTAILAIVGRVERRQAAAEKSKQEPDDDRNRNGDSGGGGCGDGGGGDAGQGGFQPVVERQRAYEGA